MERIGLPWSSPRRPDRCSHPASASSTRATPDGCPCGRTRGASPSTSVASSASSRKLSARPLAVRDGGCVWCGAPPSRCEAHHIRHWHADHGSTDLADGVLLCRNCHMRLHNQGWRIVRRGAEYHLHPPYGGPPRLLRPRSPFRFLSEPVPP
ncbi:HNH endonuclease signature motif containing protein [Microbacterium lemovicicum]|uniref:HNH endonuclease signature motif containing protein n=1 Tax=Microbacterium lemovicicum TaxID=1072463 RepID=UPI0019D0D844